MFLSQTQNQQYNNVVDARWDSFCLVIELKNIVNIILSSVFEQESSRDGVFGKYFQLLF